LEKTFLLNDLTIPILLGFLQYIFASDLRGGRCAVWGAESAYAAPAKKVLLHCKKVLFNRL